MVCKARSKLFVASQSSQRIDDKTNLKHCNIQFSLTSHNAYLCHANTCLLIGNKIWFLSELLRIAAELRTFKTSIYGAVAFS